MKIGKTSGLFIIITFFFVLNVVNFNYLVMAAIAIFLYFMFHRLEKVATKNIFLPARINIKSSFICIVLGLSLSLSTWGVAALQLVLSIDYLSNETLLKWGFTNLTTKVIEPEAFATVSWEIALLGYIFLFLKFTVVGPFVEELYFRGLALKKWEVKYGKILAVILTSVCFMLIHLKTPILLTSVFLHGVVFCLIYYRFKHIFYSFLAHASYNFAITIWNMNGAKGFFFDKNVDQLNAFATWSTEFSRLALSIFIIVAIFKLTKVTSSISDK